MAHPDGAGVIDDIQVGEEILLVVDEKFGASELPLGGGGDTAALGVSDELHAVADAQYGQAQVEDGFVGQGRFLGEDGSWAAGENDATGAKVADDFDAGVKWHDFAIDPGFADAPRDELGVLAAEVEDEDFIGINGAHISSLQSNWGLLW